MRLVTSAVVSFSLCSNHPDADASPEAAARFEQAAKAFQVLGSPDRRAQHDQALNDGQLVPPDFQFRRAMDVFEQVRMWVRGLLT